MRLDSITDVERLQRINQALMNRVESQLDQQGNSFSLFQTALSLEGQVKRRTDELTSAMHRLEKINDELALAKEAAEIANQSKTSFLAAASHDVLQPLNAALLSVSVLADLQTTQKGADLVEQVERSLENMNALLRTLLDISRLEAGVMQPNFETVALQPLYQELEADYLPMANAMGLELHFEDAPCCVTSDRTMVRRILQNLISNALRYTDIGSVKISNITTGQHLTVIIRDTGRGISAEQQSRIFEEFNRGDAVGESIDEWNTGFGLGLSIVKKMTSALGHRLEMESSPGQGTEFRLTFDRVSTGSGTQQKPPVHSKTAQAKFCDTKILLLENDPSVIDAMVALLESWGCDTVVATCTREAIRALDDSDWIPQIIIVDQHLNDGDLGTLALQTIWQYVGRPIPALVASADPTRMLEQETADMGLELLVKPVKPATLRALMTHLLSSNPAGKQA